MKKAISKAKVSLPTDIKQLAHFVIFTRERLMAVKASIRAMDRLDMAASVRMQKQTEAQDMACTLLDAEVRLGELFGGIEKASGGDRRSENFKSLTGEAFENSKLAVIKSLGFEDPKNAAYRFELLAAYPEVVEQIKQEALENEDLPTRTECLREIKRLQPIVKTPPFPKGKYRILYADPPWKYADQLMENYGAATHHYPQLSIEDLCQLKDENGATPKTMAANDAVLFLWTTSPLLKECFTVVEAWGFDYKSSFIWDKVKHNYGHYNSVRHELLLICTRGSPPAVSRLHDSVVVIPRGKHSEKPPKFRTIIDAMYPPQGIDRVELFARGTLPKHWKGWGNQWQKNSLNMAS